MDKDVWVVLDLETTGLVPKEDQILECTAIHIDKHSLAGLERVSWRLAHGAPRAMAPIVEKMHTENRLLFEIDGDREFLKKTNQLTDDAHPWFDKLLAQFFERISPGQRVVLVGSSVHFDLGFIREHCPLAREFLHYRMVDVRVLKLVFREWVGKSLPSEARPVAHRSSADCDAVLEDLRWFSDNVFRPDGAARK